MPLWANHVHISDTGEGLLIEFVESHQDEPAEDMQVAAQVIMPYDSMIEVIASLRAALNGHL